MKKIDNTKVAGFTLIELLVVIAIIAVLSIVVILSLNPAELLRQSRDSDRISDMATIKSAISLYLADQSIPSIGTSGICYTALTVATSTNAVYVPTSPTADTQTSTCASWFTSVSAATIATTSARSVGGSGWIPVNFSAISSGAPIGQEPIDPTNSPGTAATKSGGGYFYTYIASSTNFKLAAFMESTKYAASGTNDVASTDGGNDIFVYEQGTKLTL